MKETEEKNLKKEMKKWILGCMAVFYVSILTSCTVTVRNADGDQIIYGNSDSDSAENGMSGDEEENGRQENLNAEGAESDFLENAGGTLGTLPKPIKKVPEIPEYIMPAEDYTDPLEEEASAIIDDAIAKAIAAVNVMKDDRHSYVTYPYEEDANGYLDYLQGSCKELYDLVGEKTKKWEDFQIKDKDYEGSLIIDALTISTYMTYGEPVQHCFFQLDVVSDHDGISEIFFDPYQDANFSVENGKADLEQIKEDMDLMDHIIKRIVRKMPQGLTAYDQYYYLAAVLSEHITYDTQARNRYTAFGALVSGRAVCEGYSAAFLLLCKEADLWCAYRHGLPKGTGHVWNMIKLDSGIYNVDVTWCDNAETFERKWYENFARSDVDFDWNGHEMVEDFGIKETIVSTGEYEPCPYEEP